MALISCPECGGKVSDQATACPHCGYPMSKNKAKAKAPQEVRSDLFEFDGTTLVKMKRSYSCVEIPNGTTSVSKFAFSDINVKCIEIPASITSFLCCEYIDKTFDIYYDGTPDQWMKIEFEWTGFLSEINHFYVLDPKGEVTYNNKKYSLVESYAFKEDVDDLSAYEMSHFPNVKAIYVPKTVLSTSSEAFRNTKDFGEFYYGGALIDFLKISISYWNENFSLYFQNKDGSISRFGHKFIPASSAITSDIVVSIADYRYKVYGYIFGTNRVKSLEEAKIKEREKEFEGLSQKEVIIRCNNYFKQYLSLLEGIKNEEKYYRVKGRIRYLLSSIILDDLLKEYEKIEMQKYITSRQKEYSFDDLMEKAKRRLNELEKGCFSIIKPVYYNNKKIA